MRMSKHATIILFALLVALLPFVGVPTPWKTPLYVLFGLLVAALAFALRQEGRSRDSAMRERPGVDARS